MSKNKKKNMAIYIIIAVLLVSALLPIFINLGRKDKSKTESVVITDVQLTVVDHDIEFAQNSMYIKLLSGEIKTNEKITNVFVNVNGVGVQNLSYTQESDEDGYCIITLAPATGILGTVFDEATTLTCDVYVEYGGRSFKVVSKKVYVKSCWTPAYGVVDFDLSWVV